MKFSVLYGSVRHNRMGIRLAAFLINKLKERGHEVEFFDAKELNLPMLDTRYLDFEKGKAPKHLEVIAESYRQTDAFLIVGGEYNYSIQPGLKNLLDYFYHEYFKRPSALALYSMGSFGGIRAAMQLAQTMWALGMPAIPSFLSVPVIQDNLKEDGTPIDETLDKRADKFLDELEWYARALKAEREKAE